MEARSGRQGFTFIELLVTVTIISILASLVLAGLMHAKNRALEGIARGFVATLDTQVARYAMETGRYPGAEAEEGANGFPALFEAMASRPSTVDGSQLTADSRDVTSVSDVPRPLNHGESDRRPTASLGAP